MKHPGWLLMIAGAFVLLPMGWPWVMAATFWLGFVIGCFVGTRTPRPEPPVLRRCGGLDDLAPRGDAWSRLHGQVEL